MKNLFIFATILLLISLGYFYFPFVKEEYSSHESGQVLSGESVKDDSSSQTFSFLGNEEIKTSTGNQAIAQNPPVISKADPTPVPVVTKKPVNVSRKYVYQAPPQEKGICHDNKKPQKSDHKGKHMDEDCCPDPDEWPNSTCAYSQAGYGIMLSNPPHSKK